MHSGGRWDSCRARVFKAPVATFNNVSKLHHQTLNVSELNELLLKHLVKKYREAQGLTHEHVTTIKKREEMCKVHRLRGEESEICKDSASRELISIF